MTWRSVQLWWDQRIALLFPIWIWYERTKERIRASAKANERAERQAYLMGRQGTRYVAGKTTHRQQIKARRGKARVK